MTAIESAPYESRLEHLALIKSFSEEERLAWLPLMSIAGDDLFACVEQEHLCGTHEAGRPKG